MATTPTRPTATSATSATPAAAPDALSTPAQIAELADRLSACADRIHERVMKDIRAYAGAPVPEPVQDAARALFEDEVLLRQRANSLYTQAATLIVRGLGKSQAQLVKLTGDAAEKIRRIGVIGEATTLVAGLVALAGAVLSGQPLPALAAIEKIEKQVKALNALQPKPPAKA